MNLSSLGKADLILICEEVGVEGVRNKTKALITEAIKATGADADELAESLDLAKDRQREELEKRERSDRIRREELEARERSDRIHREELELELKRQQQEIELKKLDLELKKSPSEDGSGECSGGGDRISFKMKNLMQPYKAKKGKDESYLEFVYDLKANLIEWLKSAELFDNLESVVECFCLEQFYRSISEQTRLWILDQREVTTNQRAAELAEEYAVRRNLREEDRYGSGRRDTEPQGYSRKEKFGERENLTKKAAAKTQGNERGSRPNEEHQAIKESSGTKPEQKRAFEAKKPMVCFKCQKPGHIAAGCTSPNIVFSYIIENEENKRLLEPYLSDLTVNGKACRVLQVSAATMDVIHPTYVDPNGYTGGCAWIRQVVEEHSVCLPVARVCIEGPFGTLHTEAAVSGSLPLHYPYIFSNKSDHMLREKGLSFSVGSVQALTRSKARDLATKFQYESECSDSAETACKEVTDEKTKDQADSAQAPVRKTDTEITEDEPSAAEDAQHLAGELGSEGIALTPALASFQRLLSVERSTLIAEQEGDHSLQNLNECCQEGLARKNVTFHKRSGVLYRKYRDRKGIGNTDETPACFEMPLDTTLQKKGSKSVSIVTGGDSNLRRTVMLCALADCTKLRPYEIFKHKTLPTDLAFGIVVCAEDNFWMNSHLVDDWLKIAWENRPGAMLVRRSMLVLDAFWGHNTKEVKTHLADDKTDLIMIPGRMMSVLQPMDVKRMYTEWIAEEQYDLTSTGRICKPDIAVLCKWIINAWKAIPAEMIRKSFGKCCISNRLDGMDDNALWDNEDSSTDSCSDCSDE
ncbi:uncharacterized protein ISCGN_011687 [Ixodes scapularis]